MHGALSPPRRRLAALAPRRGQRRRWRDHDGRHGSPPAAAAAAAAAPISGFEWVRLAATGVPDAEGHSQPYGRVHASVVVVPPHPTAAAKDGDKGHSIILFGGESTRPYMYHAGVWRASVRGVGV